MCCDGRIEGSPARRDLPAMDDTAHFPALAERVAALPWADVARDLDAHGAAMIASLLSPRDCETVAGGYADDLLFRSRVVMSRHGFGRGEYRYFAYPLPELVADLRAAFYPPLAAIANRWNATLGIEGRYPAEHATFLAQCHADGQTRPTSLLLQYGAGDYIRLHQDLYGEHVFPLQVAVLLSEIGRAHV